MALSSSPQTVSSRPPTYSGFFEVWIVQKGTDTRLKKNVYFNSERACFYVVSEGDTVVKFRGPENGLEVIGYLQNGQIKLKNPQYITMETIHPMLQSAVSDTVTNQSIHLLSVLRAS